MWLCPHQIQLSDFRPLWVGRVWWAVWAGPGLAESGDAWQDICDLGIRIIKGRGPPYYTVIGNMTWVGIFVKMYTFPVVGGGCNTGSAGLIIQFQ